MKSVNETHFDQLVMLISFSLHIIPGAYSEHFGYIK
jgi:hypothetical protein